VIQLTYGTDKLFSSDIPPTMSYFNTAYAIGSDAAFTIINLDKFHSIMGHPHNAVLKKLLRKINFS
jgi:hypothetical protein